ncbi:MAG: insulinase family protein, partial [Deltaproteobacteria bacterium]|nr:insulinase family protein [Deltaproteobacteria bacterium]MBW2533193.1 insulinase family protein [Deltaproteobacteria bacterium]
IPYGSAEDPPGKAGLAYISAAMQDEGAGERDALGISNALADLGTSLATRTSPDGIRTGLTVLRRYFDGAFRVFADVVARPTFDPDEWERLRGLWDSQLRSRSDDPASVAALVGQAVLYGHDTPYGHPTTGDLATAESITLEEMREFHRRTWRPDVGLLVVAGDISRGDLERAIRRDLGDWGGRKRPPMPQIAPPAPLEHRPRLVLVDRPDAPQAVIALLRPGAAAADPAFAHLELINNALGGSFTSRLNQNLREKRGWSYGAGSAFIERRGIGPFYAQAAVKTGVTAAAIRQLFHEIDRMRAEGLTEGEFIKGRARDLTEMMETHQSAEGLVWRLAELGMMGLGPDHDGAASRARQAVDRPQLVPIAAERLDPAKASVVVVGPAQQLAAQLRALDLGEPERWSPEGRPLAEP